MQLNDRSLLIQKTNDMKMAHTHFFIGAVMLPLGWAIVGHAADVTWVNTDSSGGSFSSDVNWSTGVAPTSSDRAIINNGGMALVVGTDVLSIAGASISSGTLSIDGGTLASSGQVDVGGTSAGAASLVMTGGSLLNVSGRINLGTSAGTYASVNLSGTAQVSNSGSYFIIGSAGTTVDVTMSGGSRLNKGSSSELIFADGVNSHVTLGASGTATVNSEVGVKVGWNGGVAELTFAEDSTFSGTSNLYVGYSSDGGVGTGTVTMEGDSSGSYSGGGMFFVLGDRQNSNSEGGHGTMTLKDNATFTTGNGWMVLGRNAGANGTYSYGELNVEGAASFTYTGGNFFIGNHGGRGAINVSENGSFSSSAEVRMAYEGSGGQATITVSDSATFTAPNIVMGKGGMADAVNVLNLSGGTLVVNSITKEGGSGTVNFNGGTLKMVETSDVFGSATSEGFLASDLVIGSGGLTIETDSYVETVLRVGLSGVGVLTKTGNGTMTLYAKMENSGGVVIEEGALQLVGIGIAGGTLDLLRDDGKLSLGAGTSLVLDYDGTETLGFLLIQGHEVEAGVYDAYSLMDYLDAEFGITDVDITGLGYLNVTAVPEPSTYALWGAAGLVGLVVVRRRQK